MVVKSSKRSLAVGASVAALALAAGGMAQAQSNGGSMNAGYGRASTSSGNYGVAAGTRDANGNRVIVDGIIQGGLDQSVVSRTSLQGVSGSASGAGFGGATAIGNNLSVITQGNWNTVIVNSTQINNGDVTANSNSSGVGNDDGN